MQKSEVINVALNAGYEPLALLCEQKHITGDAADIIERCDDIPVYTGARELLATLTGYTLTRGVLCAMHRPTSKSVEEICRGARRIAVIEGVVDTTNIGAIFRSAAALGIDAILLTRNSCDPLNRRAVRVSMGSVFLIPWAWLDGSPNELHKLGFRTVAMALTEKSISIDSPILATEQVSHCDGNRGRRSSKRNNYRGGLCGPHPYGKRGRFTQCSCRIRYRFLATSC